MGGIEWVYFEEILKWDSFDYGYNCGVVVVRYRLVYVGVLERNERNIDMIFMFMVMFMFSFFLVCICSFEMIIYGNKVNIRL